MARENRTGSDRPPGGRFSRSGHTRHHQQASPPGYEPPRYQPEPGYDPPSYHAFGAGASAPAAAAGAAAGSAAVTGGAAAAGGKVTVTRAIVRRSNQFARSVTNKVITASQADGAKESGLTALIWNQVLSYGTDAMLAVALAGTVFFGASADAKRGNVLLYLLVTMAPFAVVAPVIGPALDRLQHGRRWAMAATGIGRAVLAIIMAGHPTNLYVLYPCALGSLVLSKAYSVIRASAAPRLVPRGLTLVEANARLSIFGLAAAIVGGSIAGVVIKATGSYSAGLWLMAIASAACAYFAFRLPKQVDSANPAAVHPEEPPRPLRQESIASIPSVGRVGRLRDWARRGLAAQVIASLQGEATLRFLAGFLTIFLAFYVEATSHGMTAALALGGIGVGAGVGNFFGNGIGTRLKLAHPERLILIGCAVAFAVTLLTAILFSVGFAILCMFISAAVNSLAKIALDAVIQRDVRETLRAGAFARSETFLQLSWVLGAALGVLLPSKDGSPAFWIAAAVVGLVTAVVALRLRAARRATRRSSRRVA